MKYDDDIKYVFSSIFAGLLNANEQEIKEDFGNEIDKLINSEHDLKNVENYDLFINYQMKKVLKSVIIGLNPEVIDRDKLSNLQFLYENHSFLKQNLASLISDKEGGSCSGDKSRWLIERYREYILEGAIPDMTIEEKCFWKPHFGTGEQWMTFCDGLMDLHSGNFKKYLGALMKLSSC